MKATMIFWAIGESMFHLSLNRYLSSSVCGFREAQRRAISIEVITSLFNSLIKFYFNDVYRILF